MLKVFVDGSEGTTGLQIFDYLEKRHDIEILKIDSEKRKDLVARARLINESDVTFLCLPDSAAKESAALCANPNTCIIDASTAHRTHEDWVYGLPELNPDQRLKIQQSKRIANPGCHATAFILAVNPLVRGGILKEEARLSAHSLTGYSGGGKKMIEQYQAAVLPDHLKSARPYALNLNHKHLPEMQRFSGLKYAPTFLPIVGNWFQGLSVSIVVHPFDLKQNFSAAEIHQCWQNYYQNEALIRIMPLASLDSFWDVQANNHSNVVDLALLHHQDHFILLCRLDNLGKGASGAAVQSMNIHFNLPENTGL